MKLKMLLIFIFVHFLASVVMLQDRAVEETEAIQKTVTHELELHPKATLLDLYKNFFQGKFGPGHLIKSRDAAEKYLKLELAETEKFDSVLIQPVGYEEKFYRVNLSLVKEEKIDFEKLVDAFTASADAFKKPDIESWKKEWNYILNIIENLNLNLPDLKKDKEKISQSLDEGIVIGHHSEEYLQNYNPHYRIVSKKNLEELLNSKDIDILK